MTSVISDPANLWVTTARPAGDDTLPAGDIACDLAIVGGGYTGLSAALHAAQAGLDVVLVEARHIGFGGSGRNVGLVNAGLWLPPEDIVRRMGQAPAERLIHILSGGPQRVFDLIEAHQIRCEAVRHGTLHCAHSPAGMRDLQRRRDQLQATGAPVRLLDATEARRRVGSGTVHGALFDPRAGTIQPLAYAQGLARAATAAGARIYQGVSVAGMAHDGRTWTLQASALRITAGALIDATNGYGPARRRFSPMYFFQAATDPLPPALADGILPGGEGCWDTALVMSSFRKDAAGRMIVGAIGSLDHAGAAVHRAWAQRKMAAMFPALAGQKLTHAWSGRIANTSDHLPRILRLGPRAYAAFGYSGRGIGTGTIFGQAMAAALITGDEDALPLAPIDGYAESWVRTRAAYYETGAVAAHLLGILRGV